MADSQYNLYVIRPEDIGEDERHYFITPDYCLLYTDKEPSGRCEQFTRLEELPAPAWEWLKEQIESIRLEYMAANRKEVLGRARQFTEQFRLELEKERRNLEEGKAQL